MTAYLALYTGPGGPISFVLKADTIEDAIAHVAEHGREHYDAGSDALDIDPEGTMPHAIDDALAAGGWALTLDASTDTDFALFAAEVEVLQ